MKKEPLTVFTVPEIMRHYHVSRAQAYRWLAQGYAVVRSYPNAMPPVDYMLIAKRSAQYVLGRQNDIDLLHEGEQAAIIAIWKDADRIKNNPAYAYQAGRAACLNVLRGWRNKHDIHLDDYLNKYESDGAGSLDMSEGEES